MEETFVALGVVTRAVEVAPAVDVAAVVSIPTATAAVIQVFLSVFIRASCLHTKKMGTTTRDWGGEKRPTRRDVSVWGWRSTSGARSSRTYERTKKDPGQSALIVDTDLTRQHRAQQEGPQQQDRDPGACTSSTTGISITHDAAHSRTRQHPQHPRRPPRAHRKHL